MASLFPEKQGSYCAVLEMTKGVLPQPHRRHYDSLGITALVTKAPGFDLQPD